MAAEQRCLVENITRGRTLAERAEVADRFLRRGMGLMGRKGLPAGGGLIIRPCNSVVSFFMRFPIDVLFVDRDGAIRHIHAELRPWRTSKIVRNAHFVVELPAGTVARSGTAVGDRIEIRAV